MGSAYPSPMMSSTTALAASVSLFSLLSYMNKAPSRSFTRPAAIGKSTAAQRLARISASKLSISSCFDSGNIEAVDTSNPSSIKLKIREEPMTEGTDKRKHFQWFYFRASNVKDVSCTYRILNAAEASFAPAYKGYKVAYSYNPSAEEPQWLRIKETDYKVIGEGKAPELTWEFKSKLDTVWFAYFAPFSYERHQQLIASVAKSPLAKVSVIGESIQGRAMDKVTIGSGPRQVWVIARQHPGESMAEWWMQGFLRELLDEKSTSAKTLREGATVHIVPNMNPDGSVLGHLRTNACGANLNREWQGGVYPGYDAPTLERSPEVYCVLEEMKKSGVDLFIDVHGDEMIPDNFFAGGQGIPAWSKRHENLYILLNYAVLRCTNEFQVFKGYGDDDDPTHKCINTSPGKANLAVASNSIGNRFNCLAATLEMPFKDTSATAEPVKGWSPERASKFGSDMVGAFSSLLPHLVSELGKDALNLVEEAKKFTVSSGSDWYKQSD